MHSTHASATEPVPVADLRFEQLLDAVGAVLGRRPAATDLLEADLALDSVDLARIAAAVSYDLPAHLAGLDFDRLVQLTVADLLP